MSWYDIKEECPNPPDCTGAQSFSHAEHNAMVAYLKDKLRGLLFTAPIAGDDGKYIKYIHATPGFVLETPAGAGDVVGPASSVNSRIVLFDGITGKLIKDGNSVIGVATGNVFKIPASIAQGDIFYVDVSGNIVRLAAGTSGHFLKTQGAAANPVWAAGVGGVTTWLELTDTPGAFTGQAGKYPKVNVGETALEFGTPAGAGDVVGPASSVAERIALFDGPTGKLIKDAGKLLSNTANNIPVLDASAILPLAQVPDLAASKITSGQFPLVRMPRAASGLFLEGNGAAADPVYNALVAGDIPGLAASKITSGEFALARIPTPLTGKDADTVDGIEGAEIFKKDGTVAMTGPLQMGIYNIEANDIYRVADDDCLTLSGGNSCAAVFHLYGKNNAFLPGFIVSEVTNAGKTTQEEWMRVEGVTDTPKLRLKHGLKSDLIEEKTAAAGVTIDGLLIKDGIMDGGTF